MSDLLKKVISSSLICQPETKVAIYVTIYGWHYRGSRYADTLCFASLRLGFESYFFKSNLPARDYGRPLYDVTLYSWHYRGSRYAEMLCFASLSLAFESYFFKSNLPTLD